MSISRSTGGALGNRDMSSCPVGGAGKDGERVNGVAGDDNPTKRNDYPHEWRRYQRTNKNINIPRNGAGVSGRLEWDIIGGSDGGGVVGYMGLWGGDSERSEDEVERGMRSEYPKWNNQWKGGGKT